jgi:D-glutamate N-acetyltransferase
MLRETQMPSALSLSSASPGLDLPRPYLLFLGETGDFAFAKTAFGLRDWAPEACVGEIACPNSRVSVGLPVLSPREARERGAAALVIGVANLGGIIRDSWLTVLLDALAAGLDVISGMHGKLEDIPTLKAAALRHGRRLIDVRTPPKGIQVATGRKRSGKRLLTVGTDCALGKKYTALCLTQEFRKRGLAADFRATGQTGILIAGGGIPIDAVVSDFVAGAAEMLSPDADCGHWDIVEGQGSVFHPSYAGVSLGLLHGTQPDVIVMCHAVGRDRIMGLEDYEIPEIGEAIELNLMLARRTNPKVRCAGVALNTVRLSAPEAQRTLAEHATQLGLPVADPIRAGPELVRLVEACLE